MTTDHDPLDRFRTTSQTFGPDTPFTSAQPEVVPLATADPGPTHDCYRIAFDVTCAKRVVPAARRAEPMEMAEAIVRTLLEQGYHLRDTIAVTRVSDVFR